MAKAMTFSLSPTTDEVDRLYHQLTEIHAIGATQLAECARWRCYDSTPCQVRAKTGQQSPNGTPSSAIMAPPLPADLSSQVSLRQQGPHGEPSARRRDRQASTLPEWHPRSPCYDKLDGRRRSCRDPRGPLAGTTRSRTHDGTPLRPLHTSIGAPKSTAEEQSGLTTHYVINTKAALLRQP
jgi:hypothetical protein